METREEIKKALKKLLNMSVIGFVVYPSCVIDDDNDGFEVNNYRDYKDLYEEVKGVYDTLFERVKEKAGKYLLRYNKSTIVLKDTRGKKWYFNTFDHSFTLSGEGCRQGWDFEFNPETDDETQGNYFYKENLWFHY